MKFNINRKWFAWYPIKVENQYVWLEYVFREKAGLMDAYWGTWTYKIYKK